MARYWIGGTGSWSQIAHWSASSGGGGGETVPTSSDDVFIDSNSGFGSGGTISVDAAFACHDFTCQSGHTFTFTRAVGTATNEIYGSFTLESGMTVSNNIFRFYSTDATATITTAGKTLLKAHFNATNSNCTYTLQDDLTTSGDFYMQNSTFDANDHNVTANDFYFYADTGYTPTVIMGSGTWEVTGGDWVIDEYSGEIVTITPETSTIKFTGGAVLGTQAFYHYDDEGVDLGKVYNNVWCAKTSTGWFTVYGQNTFNDFKVTNPPRTVKFEDLLTTTVTTFTVSGTAGNLVTLDYLFGIGQFTLSKSSGTVSCDYLDISNSNAIGGATWYAGRGSVDTTNNDGWIFGIKKTQMSLLGVS